LLDTPHPTIVIPAKAGIHLRRATRQARWTPTFVGVTTLVVAIFAKNRVNPASAIFTPP
jgi:hypothetical protein